jgi:hypothetical protein
MNACLITYVYVNPSTGARGSGNTIQARETLPTSHEIRDFEYDKANGAGAVVVTGIFPLGD